MDKKEKSLLFITVLCFSFQISGNLSLASDGNDLSGGCDKALHFFWKGRLGSDKGQAQQHYQEAIDLCPGSVSYTHLRAHET